MRGVPDGESSRCPKSIQAPSKQPAITAMKAINAARAKLQNALLEASTHALTAREAVLLAQNPLVLSLHMLTTREAVLRVLAMPCRTARSPVPLLARERNDDDEHCRHKQI